METNGTNPKPLMLAYGAPNVERLTGLSNRQLHVWDRAGIFPPSLGRDDGRGRPYFVYSFRDLVGLSTLARLRQEHGIAPAELRRFGEWLTQTYREPWSSVRFAVRGKHILFGDGTPDTSPCADEPCVEYDTLALARETAIATHRLQERSPDTIGKVTRSRYIRFGKPVLAGTRITTKEVADYHRAGYTTEAIIERYPYLTQEDVGVALAFDEQRRQTSTT